jgi:hypothetical protein
MDKTKTINWRGLTSFVVFLSFVVLALSGVILYILPHGRVAYWVDFHLLGLDKDQWDTLHTIFAFLFFISIVFHIINNYRTLWHYVVDKMKGTLRLKKELVLAVAIAMVCAAGSILFLPPFKTIKDLGEAAREAWVKPSDRNIPFPHAELQPLAALGPKLGFDPGEAVSVLRDKGLDVKGPGDSLKEIAARNDTTPSALFRHIAPDFKGGGPGKWPGHGGGGGHGQGGGPAR